MRVEIGRFKVSYADAQRLIDIAKKIDSNKEELSKNEEKEIEKALNSCKGDISCVEAMLRRMVFGANFIPEMINIPAGTFNMGAYIEDGDIYNDLPIRQIKLSAFKLGKYEVTNEGYRIYLKAIGQDIPEREADEKLTRHPVVCVSWNDAVRYCEWLSKETGSKFRLPTEAEWEYAARGTDGRVYPWGNSWDTYRVLSAGKGTEPVGSHPAGASPFGIMDMAGNTFEWVGDWYAEYNPKDLVDPKGPETGESKVFRGISCYVDLLHHLHSARRVGCHPEYISSDVGFRVAEDISTNK
jgi:formylglycine-generating enzyme required for sulfatase activity